MSPALARRYAEALYDVLDEGAREWALEELRRIAAAWRRSRELRRLLAAPMVTLEVRIAALAEQANIRAAPPLDGLLALVIDRRRLGLLGVLADAFEHVMDSREGRRRVIVRTAVEPRDTQLRRIAQIAERLANGPARIEVRVDPTIIGGVQLSCGDRVIDATLRGYLTRLRDKLAEAPLPARPAH